MTEQPTEPTSAEPVEEVADDDAEIPQTLEQAKKLRAENRNLRARLRDTEEQLGATAAQLDAAQHREVERIAGEVLVDPSDVWRAQPDMSAFVDDDFNEITRDKVVEAAKKLAADKPHLARRPAGPPPSDRPVEGLRSGARPEEPAPKPSWASAIRGHTT